MNRIVLDAVEAAVLAPTAVLIFRNALSPKARGKIAAGLQIYGSAMLAWHCIYLLWRVAAMLRLL